jgi:phospholipase A2
MKQFFFISRYIFITTYTFTLITPLHCASPYTSRQAHVRMSNALCDDEQAFIKKRFPVVKKALETFLNMPIADRDVPRIAFCCSGGGYRAMFSLFGALDGISLSSPEQQTPSKGLYTTLVSYALYLLNLIRPVNGSTVVPSTFASLGLLDLCMYASTSSGSAWGLAGLIQSSKTPQDYLKLIAPALSKNITDDVNVEHATRTLLEKYSYEQPLSLVDVYGILLSQKLLTNLGYDDPNDVNLPAQCALVATGQTPLPIYNAVLGDQLHNHAFVEFTPFEVGCSELQGYIPTWAFGRRFDKGMSQDFMPPQTLGYCMGIWGSAFSATLREFFDVIIKPKVGNILTAYFMPRIQVHSLLDYRLSPAQVYNWMRNTGTDAINKQTMLTLIDTGMACNIPVAPLINRERNVDIIIIFDATDDDHPGDELSKIKAYAHARGLRFPPIKYDELQQPCSVHKDSHDSQAPVVIYLPLIKNPGYHNGWNPDTAAFTQSYDLVYTQEEIELVRGLAQYNVAQSKQLIVDTIKGWIEERRKVLTAN